MEGKNDIVVPCCLGCLARSDEVLIRPHRVRNETLKSLFQGDTISLCILCLYTAKRAEMFIQNVKRNQILLENTHYQILDSTFLKIRDETHPLIKLSCCQLGSVALSGVEIGTEDETFSEVNTFGRRKTVQIKIEMKEEESLPLDHLEGEFVDDDEFQDVKEEANFPMENQIKTEIASDEELICLKKPLKGRVKKKNARRNIPKNNSEQIKNKKAKKDVKTVTIYITKKECMEERAQLRKEPRYLNCIYRCEDCIKGFTFKGSYDKHMEKHNEASGEYECDVCKQRMPSAEKYNNHRKYHQIRHKCIECDVVMVCQRSVEEHYNRAHGPADCRHPCPQCVKVFNRLTSLRKHIEYAHGASRARVTCAYCDKTYANKGVLKSHMMNQHPKEVSSVQVTQRNRCTDCGKHFLSPSHLKKHALTHSSRRDYYCVECDKSFKTEQILQNHLKTASQHANYTELPLPCQHCDKRFSNRRDVDRHTNSIHLNIRPFQCDKCEKAYSSSWSLREHKRLSHEGYKRPMKFPCKLCDKVFDRNQILKNHVRTHTGERPFQCSVCPLSFSQRGVLATHVKLIHLKLRRDGRPKANAK